MLEGVNETDTIKQKIYLELQNKLLTNISKSIIILTVQNLANQNNSFVKDLSNIEDILYKLLLKFYYSFYKLVNFN